MGLAAKNNEDARSFGITWESAHTHREERNASYITTRSREIVLKKGKRRRSEEVTQRGICVVEVEEKIKKVRYFIEIAVESRQSQIQCAVL